MYDGDLHLTHLSLRLSISVLTVSPSASNTVAQHIMPKCLLIAASPLLQVWGMGWGMGDGVGDGGWWMGDGGCDGMGDAMGWCSCEV